MIRESPDVDDIDLKKSIFLVGDCYGQSQFWQSNPVTDETSFILKSSKVTIGNFEATYPSTSKLDKVGPNLKISNDYAKTLSQIGFNAMSLANNHVMDYRERGLLKTIDELTKFGIDTFGAGENYCAASRQLTVEIGSTTIGIFGMCEHNEVPADDSNPGTMDIYSQRSMSCLVNSLDQNDIVVAVVHGGIEEIPIPPGVWRETLRGLIDIGVDAVIGHHPHIPQGYECYNDGYIFYSLGNWMMYEEDKPNTHWSYGVAIEIGDGSISSVNIVPFRINNGQICRLYLSENPHIKDYLRKSSNIISGEQYHVYWKALTEMIYEQRYNSGLEDFGSNGIETLIRNPKYFFGRLLRGKSKNEIQEEQLLVMIDILQNRSHIDAIKTRLVLKSNKSNDEQESKFIDARQNINELTKLATTLIQNR